MADEITRQFKIDWIEGETKGVAPKLDEDFNNNHKVWTEFIQFEAWGCSKEGRDIYINLTQPVCSDMRIQFPITEYKQVVKVFGDVIEFLEENMWETDKDGDVGVIYSLDKIVEMIQKQFPDIEFADYRKDRREAWLKSEKESEEWIERHMAELDAEIDGSKGIEGEGI